MSRFPIRKWQGVILVSGDKTVTDGAARLFTVLMEHHNTKTGLCCPSQNRLAKKLHCTVRSIRGRLRCLDRAGYIKVLKGQGMNGCDAYWLKFPSGKSEFETAEKTRQSERKPVSAKPMKEPMNKPVAEVRSAPKTGVQRGDPGICSEVSPQDIQRAQNRIAEALGEGGWLLLQACDEQLVEEMGRELALREISLKDAIWQIREEADRAGGGRCLSGTAH